MLATVAPPTSVVGDSRTTSNGWLTVLRGVCSFPVVLAVMLTVLMALTVRSRFSDPDLWWHLKTGQIIWNTHHLPTVDTFSFTAYGHPWITQEWLSQLTIYAAYLIGGYSGLMLWLCLVGGLLMVAGYLLCCLYSGNLKVAFVGGFGIWLFSTVGLSIRPQMIGYLLLTCELLVVYLGRTRNPRWFFALPPLFAVWVNCHASFFLGLAVLGVIALCSFVELQVGLLVSHRWSRPKRDRLLIAALLSVAALFINPIGPKLVWYPLDVMLNQPLNTQSVSEWQPLNFSTGRALAVLAVAGLVILVPLLRRIPLRLDELALTAVTFWFAACHIRMVFVFGIIAMPILCRLLADAWEGYDRKVDRALPNLIMLALSMVTLVLAFPSTHNLQEQVRNGNPAKALEFIKRSGLTGRMLNEYIYGGYLIWMAPEHKVFIDGRADVYEPAGVFAEYGKWMTGQEDPRRMLDKYRIDWCLLSVDSPMSRILPLLDGWRVIYIDKQAVLAARTSAQKTAFPSAAMRGE